MDNEKTLIAVLASHDSPEKNDELARIFEELHKENTNRLGNFHFLFTGGTFDRLMSKTRTGRKKKPISKKVQDFILDDCGVTVLPSRKEGGVTILANIIVQRQCSIIWPFLSPITVHWLNPENLALMRLCDLWNVKRLMNPESVRAWFRHEAERDTKRHPQEIPLKIRLSTSEKKDGKWPKGIKTPERYYRVKLPERGGRGTDFWSQFSEQTIAFIAHDDMKRRMVDFAIEYEDELVKFKRILATSATGLEIINACKELKDQEKVRICLPGPKGGDIEIATEILFDRCHTVIFFIDPLKPHPHIDDIRVVFGACMAEIKNYDVRMLSNEVQAREWIEEGVRRI